MGGGRPRSAVWVHFEGVGEDVECKRCKEVIAKPKVEKLERHILKNCPHWSARERSEYISTSSQSKARQSDRTSIDSSVSSPGGDESSDSAPTTQADLNKMVADYIFNSGASLRTVELPDFKTLALNGCPAGLKVPSRSLLGGRLLDEAVTEETRILVEDLKTAPFLVIVLDGCTSVAHMKMINIILCGRNMPPKLWKVVPTDENSQTGEFVAELCMEVIDEVEAAVGRVGFVTGTITDNAKAMVAAWENLEKKRGLICAGCGTHTMILLLQDIGKLESVKDVMDKVTRVSNFFLARKLLLARFENERKALVKRKSGNGFNKTLTLPVVTRWYSAYNCLVNVIKNRDVLTNVFQDNDFMAQYKKRKTKKTTGKRKRRSSEPEKSADYKAVEKILNDDDFWVHGKQVMKILAPIIKKVGLLEADSCSAGSVYWSFVDLLKTPLYLKPPFMVDTITEVMKLIEERWNFLHTDAMGVAFLLDPTKIPADFVDDDLQKSLKHVTEIAARLKFSKEKQKAVFKEATIFVNVKWDQIEKGEQLGCEMGPLEWWGLNRLKYPALAELARRVFSMPPSSDAAERSWSTHKSIHSKLRNRFLTGTASNLLFVYSNRQGRRKALGAMNDQSTSVDGGEDSEREDEVEAFINELCPDDDESNNQVEDISSSYESSNSFEFEG